MTPDVEPWSPNGGREGLSATRFSDVRWTAETGSTNADLLELAAKGHGSPVVLLTDHQTAGRGRQDRSWHDEPGDALLVSVLVPADQAWAGLSPLVAGLAALDGIDRFLGLDSGPSLVGLKWPNDVLTTDGNDSKLAGILTEARRGGLAAAGLPVQVVIGMGLNVRWTVEPPSGVKLRGTTLEVLHERSSNNDFPATSRDQLLVTYLRALDHWLDVVARPDGGASVLAHYGQRCLTIGRTVSFATSAGSIVGTATGVGDDGELFVTDGLGRQHRLVAGDAHHQPLPRQASGER